MQHPIAIYHLTRIPAMWAVIDCIGTAYDFATKWNLEHISSGVHWHKKGDVCHHQSMHGSERHQTCDKVLVLPDTSYGNECH